MGLTKSTPPPEWIEINPYFNLKILALSWLFVAIAPMKKKKIQKIVFSSLTGLFFVGEIAHAMVKNAYETKKS